MNKRILSRSAAVILSLEAMIAPTLAQTNLPAAALTNRQEFGQQWEKMTTEQRRAKIAETRNVPPGATNQLQDLQNLPVEERRAKIEEMRRQRAAQTNAPIYQMESRIQAMSQRAELLRGKKAAGTITEAEQQQLDGLEKMLKRLAEQRDSGARQPRPVPPITQTNSISANPPNQ